MNGTPFDVRHLAISGMNPHVAIGAPSGDPMGHAGYVNQNRSAPFLHVRVPHL
jgi:hypothetical protein